MSTNRSLGNRRVGRNRRQQIESSCSFALEAIERRLLMTGTINGTIFSDFDSNGTQAASEPGLPGWTVYIDANNNNLPDAAEQKRTTDSNGFYEFAGLAAPAQYVVREVLQGGYTQTVPGTGGVILTGPGGGGAPEADEPGPDTRPYTQTEIVVAFEGNRGLPVLQQRLAKNAALRARVDASRSSTMFSVSGSTLVEVKLAPGVEPMDVVKRLQAQSGVRWAQPNYIHVGADPREFTPNDPQYGSQFHHTLMKNNLAWDTTMGVSAVKVGMTDDGMLTNHPDLVPNMWVNAGEIAGNGVDDDSNGRIDDVNGWDFFANDNNPMPATTGDDHGTHVAGIFSAKTNNGVGVAGTAGNATIVPIRFYQSGGSWTSTMVSNSYRYAADVDCQIVTTSYNVDGFTNDNIFAAGLQYMYDAGVLHFNSAGNNNQLNAARQKWDQSIFVANTTSTDVRSTSSNYGWGVDVAAPGSSILSTAIGTSFAPTYELKSGTSMATPNAAGVAALIWSAHPDWTREQVIAQLIATADNIDAQNPSFVGLLGSGRVNSLRGVTENIAPPKFKTNGLTGLPTEGSFTLTKPTSFTLDTQRVFDPGTMTSSNFELRGDGLDGVFNTADDTLTSFTLRFGTGNWTNYMVGTNRLFFSAIGAMAPDRYRFSALAGLKDPFGNALDGDGNGTGGDAFTRTFTLLAATNQYTVNLADGATMTANFGNHDVAPPRPIGSNFALETAQQLLVQFNEDVSDSLGVADLLLERAGSGAVDTSGFTLANYDDATNTATFNVNGILANGDYTATFSAVGITDSSGNAMDGNGNGVSGDDYSFDFFFVQGDADHNGVINFDDYAKIDLGFNMGLSGFSNGDFNYDGVINFDDYAIIDLAFNTQ